MSIKDLNRIRDLELSVEQIKDMLRALYEQLNELTKQSQTKPSKAHKI